MFIKYENYKGGINNLIVVFDLVGVCATSLKSKEQAIKNYLKKKRRRKQPAVFCFCQPQPKSSAKNRHGIDRLAASSANTAFYVISKKFFRRYPQAENGGNSGDFWSQA